MYDPSTKTPVWTGRATKTLDPSSNQQKNMKNLDKAMQKLLHNYPPKQSQNSLSQVTVVIASATG